MLRESLIAILLMTGIASSEPSKSKTLGSIESIITASSPLEKKIDRIRNKYLQKRNFEKEDYYDALYTWRYFDWDKCNRIAYELIKSSAIKNTAKERKFFARGCRKYPMIKAFCTKEGIDPRLAWWVFLTESGEAPFKYVIGSYGEIGDPQIMPNLLEKYWKFWKKHPFCIDGKGPEDPINIYICGMQHLKYAINAAKCKGIPLNKLTAKQLLSIYAFYSRNKKKFTHYEKPQYNFEVEGRLHFYMFDLIDKYSSKGNLINEKGRKILEKKRLNRITLVKN